MEMFTKANGVMINNMEEEFLNFLMKKVDLMNHMMGNGKMVKCTDTELTHLKMETYMWASMPKVKSEKEK